MEDFLALEPLDFQALSNLGEIDLGVLEMQPPSGFQLNPKVKSPSGPQILESASTHSELSRAHVLLPSSPPPRDVLEKASSPSEINHSDVINLFLRKVQNGDLSGAVCHMALLPGGQLEALTISNTQGMTALHLAALYNQVPMMKHLLELDDLSPAVVNILDNDRQTPLHIAAANGKTEILRLLLETNLISKDLLNGAGDAALHIAARNGHEAAIRMLLMYHCNPRLKNTAKQTARALATARKDLTDVLPYLKECETSHLEATRKAARDMELVSDQAESGDGKGSGQTGTKRTVNLLGDDDCGAESGTQSSQTTQTVTSRPRREATNLESVLAHKAILEAVKESDMNRLLNTLQSISAPNLRKCADSRGSTALHHACITGDLQIASVLLEADEKLHRCLNLQGDSALVEAAVRNHLDILLLLLKKGADPNVVNKWGNTALMSACSLGCSRTALALLEAGALVDVKNKKGETARERACEQGDAEVMALILQRSKDFDVVSDAGGVLLYKACMSGFTGPAFVLIGKMAPVRCVVDGKAYSALEAAKSKPRNLLGETVKVSEDRSSLVAKLREISPETPEELMADWRRAEEELEAAAAQARIKEEKLAPKAPNLLLSPLKGEDSEPKKPKPAKQVAETNRKRAGVQVQVPTRIMKRRLATGEAASVRTHVISDTEMGSGGEAGAGAGALASAPGSSALEGASSEKMSVAPAFAMRTQAQHSAEFIAAQEALHALCVEDEKESTAKLSRMLRSNKLIDINYQSVDTGETALHLAALNGNYHTVDYLVGERGADVDLRTIDGDTPLHYACYGNHGDIAWYLMTRGQADSNSKNNEGDTPLHNAALHGHDSIAAVLITKGGADVNAQDNEGWAPIHYVANRGLEGHIRVLKLLIAKNCNFYVQTKTGANCFTANLHPDAKKIILAKIKSDEDKARAKEAREKARLISEIETESESESEESVLEDDGKGPLKNKNKSPKAEVEEPAVPKERPFPPPLDMARERLRLREVRAQIHADNKDEKSAHLVRMEEILTADRPHPTEYDKESRHWHRPYLLQQLKRLRQLSCGTPEDIRLLHEVENSAVLASSKGDKFESWVGGGPLFSFMDAVVKPADLFQPSARLSKNLFVEWAFGKHQESLRGELSAFYLEAKLCPGMGSNSPECRAFWRSKLGEKTFSVILRDKLQAKIRGALTGHLMWTTKKHPVIYITLLRCDEYCRNLRVQVKETIPSHYLFLECQAYVRSLIASIATSGPEEAVGHILTQSVGYKYFSKPSCVTLERKNCNLGTIGQKGRVYWRKHMQENAYADFFGAQLILADTGIDQCQFVEEENAFLHLKVTLHETDRKNSEILFPPRVTIGTNEYNDSEYQSGCFTNARTSVSPATAATAATAAKRAAPTNAAGNKAKSKEKEEVTASISSSSSSGSSSASTTTTSSSADESKAGSSFTAGESNSSSNEDAASHSLAEEGALDEKDAAGAVDENGSGSPEGEEEEEDDDAEAEEDSEASNPYTHLEFEDLIELMNERKLSVSNPYRHPQRTLRMRTDALRTELRKFDRKARRAGKSKK